MRLLRLWLTLVSLSLLFVACQQVEFFNSSSSNTSGHKHIKVIASGTGINPDGIWPPQPANMSQKSPLANTYALQALNVQKASVKEKIMADSSLITALGTDYLLLDVNISKDKLGKLTQEVILFSYSNNSTVRAWLDAYQDVEFEVMAASEYQFPEAQVEIDKAIALAKTALVNQGFSNAQNLNAHAMLTYPNEASGEQFYDVRMLYVTIGEGNGAVPIYAAWVDLSNDTVTASGPIGSY